MRAFRFRSVLAAFGLLLACSFPASPLPATTTYQFTGTCASCTGNAIGTLTVLNTYVPGGAFLAPSFVSFTFSSNLGSFTVSSGASVSGRLEAGMPSPASVAIGNGTDNIFQSDSSGEWCVSTISDGCTLNPASTSSWGPPGSPTPSASPAPALNNWMLAGLAMALAAMGSILVKKIQARSAA